jgi:hypothetical protein
VPTSQVSRRMRREPSVLCRCCDNCKVWVSYVLKGSIGNQSQLPTGVVVDAAARQIDVAAAVAVRQEPETLEEKGAVGGPPLVPVTDSSAAVHDLEDNITDVPTEYDAESYLEDTLTYVTTDYGSGSESDWDQE